MDKDQLNFTVSNMLSKYGKEKAILIASGYALNNAFGKSVNAEVFWKEVIVQLKQIKE